MPRTKSQTNSDDEDKNAPFKSARRSARASARKQTAGRARPERRLTIRSEQREQPDVRKIARAIIAMAVAEAEREAQAQAEDADAPGAAADATDVAAASETADD